VDLQDWLYHYDLIYDRHVALDVQHTDLVVCDRHLYRCVWIWSHANRYHACRSICSAQTPVGGSRWRHLFLLDAGDRHRAYHSRIGTEQRPGFGSRFETGFPGGCHRGVNLIIPDPHHPGNTGGPRDVLKSTINFMSEPSSTSLLLRDYRLKISKSAPEKYSREAVQIRFFRTTHRWI